MNEYRRGTFRDMLSGVHPDNVELRWERFLKLEQIYNHANPNPGFLSEDSKETAIKDAINFAKYFENKRQSDYTGHMLEQERLMGEIKELKKVCDKFNLLRSKDNATERN